MSDSERMIRDDSINSIWSATEILDLLARDDFVALRNYGTRWGIAHKSFDGESVAEIFDADLNRLLLAWNDLAVSLDASSTDRQTA